MTFSRWSFPQSHPVEAGRVGTKPCAIGRALEIDTTDGLHLLRTARLAYGEGDDWVGQRYLFAALVKGHPTRARPEPARLAQAEQMLKSLL